MIEKCIGCVHNDTYNGECMYDDECPEKLQSSNKNYNNHQKGGVSKWQLECKKKP